MRISGYHRTAYTAAAAAMQTQHRFFELFCSYVLEFEFKERKE
jgi:hypothetical protein